MAFKLKVGSPLDKKALGKFLQLLGGKVSATDEGNLGATMPDTEHGVTVRSSALATVAGHPAFQVRPRPDYDSGDDATKTDLVVDGELSSGGDIKLGRRLDPVLDWEPCQAPTTWTNILSIPLIKWCWQVDPKTYIPLGEGYINTVEMHPTYGLMFVMAGPVEYNRDDSRSNIITFQGLDDVFCDNDMWVRVRIVERAYAEYVDQFKWPTIGVKSRYKVESTDIAAFYTGAGRSIDSSLLTAPPVIDPTETEWPMRPTDAGSWKLARAKWVIEVRK